MPNENKKLTNSLQQLFNQSRGFTLIELLVVISIIGMFSSIILSNFSTSRLKVQNAKRDSDIHQYRNALETYYSDHEAYPSNGLGNHTWSCLGHYPTGTCGNINESETLNNMLSPYIPELPGDTNNLGYYSSIKGLNINYIGYWYNCSDLPDEKKPCQQISVVWFRYSKEYTSNSSTNCPGGRYFFKITDGAIACVMDLSAR